MVIRRSVREDLAGLQRVIARTGLFLPALLEPMMLPALSGEGAGDVWFTCVDGEPVGVVFCGPEPMTSGTWNLRLIAVDPAHQGRGVGRALTERLETMLVSGGARLLLVETSCLAEYERARAFYRSLGFVEEARIRDFYQAGEDKVVFSKALGSLPCAGL